MIYDIQTLKNKYKDYANINQKIALDCKNGKLTRIKRGLYTDDIKKDALIISNVCYGPSYLSFEYALSYYGLIPEYVSAYTSATYIKKNTKIYQTEKACFIYRSIPKNIFAQGVVFLKNENDIRYKIASKEKALCDLLYSMYPVRSIKDLKVMLFDDLRIDEEEFKKLDFSFIKTIANDYHSNTLYILVKYIDEEMNKNAAS